MPASAHVPARLTRQGTAPPEGPTLQAEGGRETGKGSHPALPLCWWVVGWHHGTSPHRPLGRLPALQVYATPPPLPKTLGVRRSPEFRPLRVLEK